jgi:hypothetical protein
MPCSETPIQELGFRTSTAVLILEGRYPERSPMPRCRSFKIIDAMILIGVAALGMAEIRPGWNQFYAFWAGMKTVPTTGAYLRMGHSSATILLINVAVAYVWIRLVRPRLPIRDMLRQPGALGLILLMPSALVYAVLDALIPTAPTNLIVGIALALSWVAACFHFRSIAEPGWIEGFGRLVAISLIAAVATSYS